MSDIEQTARPVILSVRNLVIEVMTDHGFTRAVNDISFDVHEGEVLSIVGESGSGKSLTMLAILGLLPASKVRVASGEVTLGGQSLLKLSQRQMNAIRGKQVAMIFQDPMTSLNPVITIGSQIAEMIQLHNPGMSRAQIRDRGIELLTLVGVPNPARRYAQYPHEFSGGMRQRAMIALAVANDPKLLIADEPTTALDVTIQAQVMDVLARVREATGAAMVLVTHDLGLVAENADNVGVMYGGRLMERANVLDLFETPSHPYTIGLLQSLPRHDEKLDHLFSIPGQPPTVGLHPSGCVFHPRCSLGKDRPLCRTEVPKPQRVRSGQQSACHYVSETGSVAAENLAYDKMREGATR